MIEGGALGFGAIGLLHESERPQPLRVGDRVRVRITHVREDGRVNVTLSDRKEVSMDQDSVKLFEFLKERPNGAMPYSDETPADLIKQRFNMSKSAFKRAAGRLMKAGLCTQDGNWTKLTELGARTDKAEAVTLLDKLQSEQRKPGNHASTKKPFASKEQGAKGSFRPQSSSSSAKPRTMNRPTSDKRRPQQ